MKSRVLFLDNTGVLAGAELLPLVPTLLSVDAMLRGIERETELAIR